MSDSNEFHPSISGMTPWIKNPNSIWLGTTLTILRNVEKFPFPGKLTEEKRKQILALLGKDLLKSELLIQPIMIKSEEMPPSEKEFLMEHFLTPQSFIQAHGGEAFVIDETGEFLATLNVRDHLTMTMVDHREELEITLDKLIKLESNLSKSIKLAFSSRFGFLTADPMQCGTGLLVYVFLHLPALIFKNKLDEKILKVKDEGLVHTGFQGAPQDIIGDIVVFHNGYTLGVTEENIVTSLRTLATKLLVEENSTRLNFSPEDLVIMKDKVSRAYAILLHSYQIHAVETLNALSLLKLGLDLGWVSNTTHAVLNQLIIKCRRAHLQFHYKEKINPEDVLHKRSEFIHKALQGVNLLI